MKTIFSDIILDNNKFKVRFINNLLIINLIRYIFNDPFILLLINIKISPLIF